jgi:hypothetical protein
MRRLRGVRGKALWSQEPSEDLSSISTGKYRRDFSAVSYRGVLPIEC